MSVEFSKIDSIDIFKAKLINKTLVVTSFLLILNQTLGTIRSIKYGEWIGLILTWVAALIIIIATIYRNKLSTFIKAVSLILGVSVALVSGLISFGFLASAKYYILIVPIILSFIVSTRRTIVIFSQFVLVYIIFGFLYSSGILTYNFKALDYINSGIAWWLDTGILIIGSLGFIYFSSHYHDEIISNYNKIEGQNTELRKYKEHLEILVEQRTNELSNANTALEEKNNKLNITLDQLQITQSQLVESEKMASIGVLTAGVSHEINNPLNFIKGGYVGLTNYLEEKGIKDETVEILMSNIDTGINRASAIVKGLNQFSRSNKDYNENADLKAIISNCLVMVHNQVKHKIELEITHSNNSLVIKGNVGKLHQVFMNILTNSIQAIPQKGKISIKTEINDDNAIVEITDDGVGISKENLLHIIEPFFTTKEPGEGTGLGLAIAYSIIKDHNGTLAFESEVGKGTTVLIKLPIQKWQTIN